MLADHQGTIRDLVDGQLGSPTEGEVVNHLTYDAYGQLLDQTASDPALQTRYGYTGQELDAETGLMYYNARWYDPRNGRFISEDPIGINGGDYNLSRYVANSPTNGTDPSGMFLYGIISGIAGWLGQREGQRAAAELQTVWSNSADMATGRRVYTTAGTAIGSLVGVRQVSDACAVHDAVDGHEQSVGERTFDGAFGTVQLVGTGFSIGGMLGAFGSSASSGLTTISRWGRPGLETGDWVMKGGVSRWNYFWSGKWQPWDPVFQNQFAPYGSGQNYAIPPSMLQWPSGVFGVPKGVLGQRIYCGPGIPPQ